MAGTPDYLFPVFPGYRRKAVTLSYDDGIATDRKLIEIMKKNGLRGTFNLNSGLFAPDGYLPEPESTHRLDRAMAAELYSQDGVEVALHGCTHPFLEQLPTPQAVMEIVRDRQNLEALFGCLVRGMAYPYGTYNDGVVEALRACGVVYSRTTHSTRRFDLPADWLRLSPTCHHKDAELPRLTSDFINAKYNGREPQLFYLWGHSYEFQNDHNWNIIEDFAEAVGSRDDVWYATNMEIYDYLDAYRHLIFSMDCAMVHNPNAIPVLFRYRADDFLVNPGETIRLK